MKSLKRWIALLVVFTMVAGLGIHQFGNSLKANEADVEEPTTEAQSTEEAAVPEDPAAEEPEALQDQDALVSEVENEGDAEKAEYTITIKEPETDGGSIFAWTDGSKEKVEFTGGEYAKTAEEGTTFHMEIKAKSNYEVSKVTDGSGNAIATASVSGSTYSYEMADIAADQQINITYSKAAKAADKKDSSSDSKKEEAAADDDEESEPASAKAADTVLTTTVGSTVITVTAPAGALPEGAYVKAFKADSFIVEKTMKDAAEAEGKELVDYAAFNITIYDKDGVEIQPDDTVKVMISGVMVQGGEKNIYHITSEGAEKVDGTATGSTAVFNAEHFSIYLVSGTDDKPIKVDKTNKTIEVNVGDVITLECKNGDRKHDHEWELKNNKGNLEIVGDDESYQVKIRALDASGDSSITVYCDSDNNKNRVHIKVIDNSPYIDITGGNEVTVGGPALALEADTNIDGTVKWSTSDSSIATVDQNGNVTGIKKGKVIIYAEVDGKFAEHEVTVNRNESNGQYVYLYVKVEGDTDGLTINGQGWITIGRLWVDSLGAPDGGYSDNAPGTANWELVMDAMSDPDNIDRFNQNTSIDLSSIDWTYYGLKRAHMATDYISVEGVYTWHLDGYVSVDNFGVVEINYYDQETNEKIADSKTINAEAGTVIEADDFVETISGYTYVSASPGSYTIQKKQTGEINIYYEKGTFSYTVKYVDEDGNALKEDKHATAEYNAQISAENEIISIPGYEYVSASPDSIINIGTDVNSNVIQLTYREKAHVTINYEAKPGGTVARTSESLNPETGVAEGSTATANDGYRFAGWYTSKDCTGTPISTNATYKPTKPDGGWEPATYYAKFEADTVSYSVEYYLQKDDGGYEIASDLTKNLTGTAGTAVSLEKHIKTINGYYFDEDNDFNVKEATIAGDGSTVLKAYYNKKYEITVEAKSKTVKYDGEEKSVSGFKTVEFTVNGQTYTVSGLSASAEGTNAGEYTAAVTGTAVVKDAADNDVTAQFTVNTENGKLTIEKRNVTVTANAATKEFATEDPKFEATVAGTIGDDTVKYTVSRPGAGTDEAVGTYTNAIVAAGEADQGNYSVTYVPADFTITKNQNGLTLTAVSNGGVYNGKPYALKNVKASLEGATIEYKVGDGAWTTEAPTATNVSESISNISVRATLEGYETAKVEGLSITVTPKPVTVTANAATKEFATEDPKFKATVAGTIGDDTVKYTVSRPGAGTDEAVGTYTNAIVAAGEADQGNYSVTYVPADFTITKNQNGLTLTAVSNGGVYNGKPYALKNVKASLEGATIEYKVGDGAWTTEAPTATNVSESISNISVRATLEGYETAKVEGLSITVTPKPVTVTANAATKEFATEDPKFKATVAGTIGDDTVKYTVSRPGAGTDEAVGTYTNAIVAAGEADQGNYSVTYVPADFTITKNQNGLTLTAVSNGGVYNGKPYALKNVKASLEGATIEYKVGDGAWTTEAPTATNVSESISNISVRATLEGYETAKVEGLSITVTPKPVTVTANAATKEFATEDPKFKATVAGTIGDDTVKYTVSRPGAGTDEAVGTYTNAIVAAGEADQGNYSVTYVPADFTITKNQNGLTLTAVSNGGVYNGKPYALKNVKASLEGATIEYKVGDGAWTTEAPTATNVSESISNISVRATLEGYETAKVEGLSITVTPKPVTVTAKNSSKIYGTSDPEFEATVAGTIGDDTVKYTVTRPGAGTDEAVGTYTNAIVAAGEADQGNYKVSFENADFEIKAQSIVPGPDIENPIPEYLGIEISNPEDTEYNGLEQKQPIVVTDKDGKTKLIENVDYTLEYSSDVTNVGTVKITIKGIGNYTGEAERTYKITPAKATIIVADKSKVYDAPDPEFTGSVSGLIGTDTLGTITYSRTNDDEDVGVYEEVLTAAVTDLNKNYTYEVFNGNFTITQAEGNIAAITSKAEDLTKFYDGEGVSVEAEASKANSTLLYSTDGETWSETNPSYTNAGSYTVYVKATHKNYEDTPVVSATIVINPRTVVMTSGSASKIYDEKPLRSDKITVTEYDEEKGEGFIKGEGAEYTFTGTQTEIGESDNTFTYTLNEGTNAANYYITTNYGKLTVVAEPVTPGGNPAGPVSPDTVIRTVTGAPPAVAAVLGGALDNAAATVRELITDEDGDVPLANMKGEHKCCIFHFLLMLLALIILALYTRSMKKRQKEIFELREKIDEERARRGLPPVQKK